MDKSHTTQERGVCPQELPAEFLAAVRSRVPFRLCHTCGESIGAARLTLLPEALSCAWCAGASHHPMATPASMPNAITVNGATSARPNDRPPSATASSNFASRLAA